MNEIKIAVIGLGYVGLPLARLFSTKYETVGFDLNQSRVDALNAGHDATLEVADELLQDAINNHGFKCTTQLDDIRDSNFYVVAVPTPVDENNRPDLKPLWGASETVGKVISKGDIVVYESTVYPPLTHVSYPPPGGITQLTPNSSNILVFPFSSLTTTLGFFIKLLISIVITLAMQLLTTISYVDQYNKEVKKIFLNKLEEYTDIAETEDFKALMADMDKFSVEELTVKCDLMYAAHEKAKRKTFAQEAKYKKPVAIMFGVNAVDTANDKPYGDLWDD